jgi:hypothetical protein
LSVITSSGSAQIIIGEGVELIKIGKDRYEARLKVGSSNNAPIESTTPPARVKKLEVIVAEGVELIHLGASRYEARLTSSAEPQPPPEPTPQPPPTPVSQIKNLGTIEVQNLSTRAQDSDIQRWIPAIQTQIDQHVAPAWNMTTTLVWLPKGELPTAGNAQAGFFDNTDTPGAAAWHDVGPNGEPLIKVFMDAGGPSVSFSHEICETVGDWNAETKVKGLDEQGKEVTMWQEICDPVESNTYQIDGVDVSDFVTPNWFNELPKTNNMDYLKVLAKQFQIAQGGYMELSYDQGNSWTQVNKGSQRKHMHASPHSRWSLYKQRPADRKRSTFQMKAKKK